MWTLLLAPLASADCTPLEEPAFRAGVLDAQVAADMGDSGLQRTLVAELEDAVPCMQFAPNERAWADFLMQVALARFGEGGDWQAPLTTALRLRPTLDRGVGGAHPIARFEPEEIAADPVPLPEGAVVYVDGKRQLALPDDDALHLVQFTADDRWRSVLVDRPPELDALLEPIPNRDPWRTWGGLGLVYGRTGLAQRHSDAVPNLYTPTSDLAASHQALRGRLGARYLQTAGLLRASVQLADLSLLAGSHLDATLGWGPDGLAVGAGLGVQWADVVEGSDPATTDAAASYDHREVALPYGQLATWTPQRRCQAGAALGLGASLARLDGNLGCVPLERFPVQIGLTGGGSGALFAQPGSEARVRALQWFAGLELAAVLREAR